MKGRGLVAGLALIMSCTGSAAGQTRQFLDAPVVKAEVQVRWNSDTKAIQWQADGLPPFHALQSDSLFLAKDSLYITYPFLNPLKVQATASVTTVEDPAFSVITKLLDALTSVVTTVAPVSTAPALVAAPPSCSSATDDLKRIKAEIFGPEKDSVTGAKSPTTSETVNSWIKTIDNSFGTGPQAIDSGIQAIKRFSETLTTNLKNVDNDTVLETCITNALPAEKPSYIRAVITAQEWRKQASALVASATELQHLLETQYLPTNKWMPDKLTAYVISTEIAPTFQKMQNVTIKISTVTLKVNSDTGTISTEQQTVGSATFSVRRYSLLTPEVGVGAVFGSIKQPTYGTAMNSSGQTVVAKVSENSVSVNPTIMANFVCRCRTGLLVPMFQIGAATSKSLPAILLGGGLRLFGLGKGDVAIGGGAMFAWYKDLQKLKVGDVVSGTAVINADLGYSSQPKIGGYLAIQYKF